jgi:hypothetical protein
MTLRAKDRLCAYAQAAPQLLKLQAPERGAGDETRTRDINLGKVALYQLSYTRMLARKES